MGPPSPHKKNSRTTHLVLIKNILKSTKTNWSTKQHPEHNHTYKIFKINKITKHASNQLEIIKITINTQEILQLIKQHNRTTHVGIIKNAFKSIGNKLEHDKNTWNQIIRTHIQKDQT